MTQFALQILLNSHNLVFVYEHITNRVQCHNFEKRRSAIFNTEMCQPFTNIIVENEPGNYKIK